MESRMSGARAGAGSGAGSATDDPTTTFLLTGADGDTIKVCSGGFTLYNLVDTRKSPIFFKTEQDALAYCDRLPNPHMSKLVRNGWNDWGIYVTKPFRPTEQKEWDRELKPWLLMKRGEFSELFNFSETSPEALKCTMRENKDRPECSILYVEGVLAVHQLMEYAFHLLLEEISKSASKSRPPRPTPSMGCLAAVFTKCASTLADSGLAMFVSRLFESLYKNPINVSYVLYAISITQLGPTLLSEYPSIFKNILMPIPFMPKKIPQHAKSLYCLQYYGVKISAPLGPYGSFLHQIMANEIDCSELIKKFTDEKIIFNFKTQDDAGNTPLMIAILTRNIANVIALIVAMQKSLSLSLTRNKAGWNELDAAIMLGMTIVVRSLIKIAAPEDQHYPQEFDRATACSMLASVYTSPERLVGESRSVVQSNQYGVFSLISDSGEGEPTLLVKSRENAKVIDLLQKNLGKNLDCSCSKTDKSVLEACEEGFQEIQSKFPHLFLIATSAEAGAGAGARARTTEVTDVGQPLSLTLFLSSEGLSHIEDSLVPNVD
jgi:hypothetical protein